MTRCGRYLLHFVLFKHKDVGTYVCNTILVCRNEHTVSHKCLRSFLRFLLLMFGDKHVKQALSLARWNFSQTSSLKKTNIKICAGMLRIIFTKYFRFLFLICNQKCKCSMFQTPSNIPNIRLYIIIMTIS